MCLAILRGLRAQLAVDRIMRPGALSVVEDADGVMMDGIDEINDFYAGAIGETAGDGGHMHR